MTTIKLVVTLKKKESTNGAEAFEDIEAMLDVIKPEAESMGYSIDVKATQTHK